MYFNCGNKVTTKMGPGTGSDATSSNDIMVEKSHTSSDKSEALSENRTSVCDWSSMEGVFASEFLVPKGKDKAEMFLKEICSILTTYVMSEGDSAGKVLDFHHPHQLKEMMSHCLNIHEEPRDLEQLLSDCKETLKYCIKTGHPHFFNQLSTGIDIVGVAGAWLSAAANTNMFTYEAAPVFTLMEEVILQRMSTLIGWDECDSVLAPGGAVSNLYGVLMARHYHQPEVKQQGLMGARTPVIFTSDHSHFSIKRAAALLGIGTNNVIYVGVHSNGKMDVSDLRAKVQKALTSGQAPIMVNATCGTTVLGAFDPINEIADLCEETGMWLHIDAAWGGGILLSRDHKYLFNGVTRADSITWNPHKMMGVPLQCSAFLTKHKGILKECNSLGAAYLFQKDKPYDISYDTGDATIQCGRHNDIFKLWLMWRAKGDIGFEEQINKNFVLAAYLRDRVKERAGFHLVIEQFEAPNVCFWYLPPAWRTRPLDKIKDAHLHLIAPQIKGLMMESGTLMVQYQPLGDLPNLFRVAISNPILTSRDLDFLLDEIDQLGKDIPLPQDWD